MVNKSEKTTRNVGIGAGIIVVVLLCVFLWPSGIGPAGFSISGKDIHGDTIDDDAISWTRFGVKVNGDESDWSDFELIDSGTDLGELTAADIAEGIADGYTRQYLNTTAMNENATWRPYVGMWLKLALGGENVLHFDATPTKAGAVLFSQSFVTEVANITESETITGWDLSNAMGNFSVSVGMNNTDIGECAYTSRFDYEAQASTKVKLVFNFNSTSIDNNDLAIVHHLGDYWVRSDALYNTTAIAFECASFTQISTIDFIWDDDVATTGICISEFLVVWEPAITTGATSVLFRSS